MTNKTIIKSLELQIDSIDDQINNLYKIRNDLYIKYCNIIDSLE